MISSFIILRWKQMLRIMGQLGPVRLVIFIAAAFFILGVLTFKMTENDTNAVKVTAAYFAIILIVHVIRKDADFLEAYFPNYRIICFTEYVLASATLIVSLLYHSLWTHSILFLIATSFLATVRLRPKRVLFNSRLLNLIPGDCFEWKAGARKTLLLIAAFWFTGLSAAYYMPVIPVVIFFLGVIPANFYTGYESLPMLLAFEKPAKSFIALKIVRHVTIYSVLTVPLIVEFILIHPETWYLPLIEYLLFVSWHIYLVLVKYTFYEPDGNPAASQVFPAIGMVCIFIPFLLPVLWLLIAWFYFKSIRNLNPFLHDYYQES